MADSNHDINFEVSCVLMVIVQVEGCISIHSNRAGASGPASQVLA